MRRVWPLACLAVRALLRLLNMSRTINTITSNGSCHSDDEPPLPSLTHPKLKPLFSKHVKPKKQHEIQRMAEVCTKTARDCGNVRHIVDFGAGLGHLSRRLSFGYGLNVCCLEQQKSLSDEAANIDAKLLTVAAKYLGDADMQRMGKLVHLNMKLCERTSVKEFLLKIVELFGVPNSMTGDFAFGIVGLHPCGDLAAILLKMFLNCPQAKFINIVGCCYMKLSCNR